MAGKHYTFTVRYDEAMVLAGVDLFLRRSVWRQTGLLFAIILGASSLVLIYAVMRGDRSWMIGLMGACILFIAISFLVLRRAWRSQAVERLRRMGEPVATFTLTDEAISVTSGIGSSSTPWRFIVDVWETQRFWLLFQAPNQFFTLPTAGVPDEALAFVREQVRAHKDRSPG